MRLNKNIKFFLNYFLGPLLFLWLSFSIWQQILRQPQLEASWLHIKGALGSVRISLFFAALALVAVNWGIEARKWQLSVRSVFPLSYGAAFKAVLSGASFSVTTPNRVGEYVGRILYLPDGQRLKTVSLTLVGSISQLLVTVVTGTIGLFLYREELLPLLEGADYLFPLIAGVMIAGSGVLALLYFRVASAVDLFRKWVRRPDYYYLVASLKNFNVQLLSRILLLSFLRYVVFMVQYLLLFYLFGVDVPADAIWWMMSIVFLSMAVIPSIALIEVGLRGEISLRLMGLFSGNSLGIGLTSITVWFLNLILPAVVGSLLILRMKIFNKKDENL